MGPMNCSKCCWIIIILATDSEGKCDLELFKCLQLALYLISPAVILSEVKGQNAPWTQASPEAARRAQVLDAGQTGRSVHHQVEVRPPQAERLPAHHSVHQVSWSNYIWLRCDESLSCSF